MPDHSPERSAYGSAKRRCVNPKNKDYKNYGGRGIKFLFTSFPEFLATIGRRPSPHHCLDRKDNDGNYEVGNVRWVASSVSIINARKHPNTTSIYRGVSFKKQRQDWQAQITVNGNTIHLGYFPSATAAAQAYDAAALKYHGKDAHLNFAK